MVCLEKQFRKTFDEASSSKGVTGENLIKLLESRLDNTVFAWVLLLAVLLHVNWFLISILTVNGEVVNVPSYQLKPGDVIVLKKTAQANTAITSAVRGKNTKINWLDWNETEMKGTLSLILKEKAFLRISRNN